MINEISDLIVDGFKGKFDRSFDQYIDLLNNFIKEHHLQYIIMREYPGVKYDLPKIVMNNKNEKAYRYFDEQTNNYYYRIGDKND